MKLDLKPIIWMGSSREALRSFPEQVRRDIGQALYTAQQGETDPAAKPLKSGSPRAAISQAGSFVGGAAAAFRCG